MDNKKTGEFIASLRKEKKLTQTQLAEKLFVSDKAVSKWERGLSYPDIGILKDLAKELDVNVSEILNGEKIENISVDKSEDIVTDSISFFNKKYFKKKIIKISFIVLIAISVLYLLVLIIGERTYGGFSIGRTQIELPSFSKIGTKNLTKKFIKAVKDDNYKTINELLVPQNVFYEDEYPLIENYITNLKEVKEAGITIKDYKYNACYFGGYSYYCRWIITFSYKGKDFSIDMDLDRKGAYLTLSGCGWGFSSLNNNADQLKEFNELHPNMYEHTINDYLSFYDVPDELHDKIINIFIY